MITGSKIVADQSLVFVYGLLKRGFSLHHHLANAEFISDAQTRSIYFLVNCRDYPGLRYAGGQQVGLSVVGEVFRVDSETLSLLDEVEGVSEALYRRERVRLQGTFEQQPVWAWFYVGSEFDGRVIGDRWV